MRNNDKSAAPFGRLAEKAAALICVLALVLGISGCSAENKSISIYDLQKTMIAADENLPEMLISNSNEENAEKTFSYLSEMDYNKVSGFFLAYTSDGMAYEIAAVELKDGADMQELRNSLQKHLDGRISLYKTYEPGQVQRAENAVIRTKGNVCVLIMCDNISAVETAFNEFLK